MKNAEFFFLDIKKCYFLKSEFNVIKGETFQNEKSKDFIVINVFHLNFNNPNNH